MRHFAFVSNDDRDRLFLRAPEAFGLDDDPELLGAALGATLYCPATRTNLADDIVRRTGDGMVSVVVCLEDAVADEQLLSAEANAIAQLRQLSDCDVELPMIFIRVRAATQIPMILDGLGPATSVLAGFVVPKFTEEIGRASCRERVSYHV